MFCKNCGVPIEENAHFCKNCGTPISTATSGSKSPRTSFRKNKSLRIVILALLLLIICATGCFFIRKYNASLGYFDNNKWGISIERFEKKYSTGYEYDKDSADTKTSFSIPIKSFESVNFDLEETASCIFQDGQFYYVQIFFRTEDPFKDANNIAESLTKKLGTPSKSEPQYGTYHWDMPKSNIEVTVLSRTAVAIWYGDISSPYNTLNTTD